MGNEIDVRSNNDLDRAIRLAQHTVYKRYLNQLEQYALLEPTEVLLDEKPENCLRFLKLKKMTCKKGEDIIQKLTTVYHASMSLGCSLIVMIDVEKMHSPANIYLGVRNNGENSETKANLMTSFSALESGISSNFPGTEIKKIPSKNELPKMINDIFGEHIRHISSVSCAASIRDKTNTNDKSFIQGLERFIDAMNGTTYTAIFIAEPIGEYELKVIRSGYEELYSTLSSFKKSIWSYNESDSVSVMESLSKSISHSVTEGTSSTQAHAFNVGMNIGVGGTVNSGTAITNGKSSPTTIARIGQGLSVLGAVGTLVTFVNPPVGGVLKGISAVGAAMAGGSTSNSVTQNIGRSMGLSGGVNAGYTRTYSSTDSQSETDTEAEIKTSGKTNTKSTGRTLQIENVNKPIEEMLNLIQEQLKRIREEEDYGAHSCGAYFLSGKQDTSLLAANTYRALMIGEDSSIECGAINSWNKKKVPEKVDTLKEYLKRFVHPMFLMPYFEEVTRIEDLGVYTPGIIVSGLELPLHLGLPTRSVFGLPIVEHAEFGRNITKVGFSNLDNDSNIGLGTIFHMGKVEKDSRVDLNASSLASHTFITGSTGAGKTNAVCQILKELNEKGIHYLVIEPAKGEFKNVFGNDSGVNVYGTNPYTSPLLKLNPFKFPSSIHVLEHIDRLVEIFNACWPMYAAMPIVLKDAIERAYEDCGWNLLTSKNIYDSNFYPSFSDVARNVKQIIESSEYDTENKGAYKGSLLTRLRSLTNGINGMIFTNEEISNDNLFDENVIVDLSRVGSTETKSLIMGMLILKLQEYRLSSYNGMNRELNHVTVLEEAHNILKRTSPDQPTESSNLLGKSVEMISNSIAEMRAYGEGFIIADQAPGLLDMAAIRNTNTKIIMRLPDQTDREVVGYAAGLNDDQITELAKLPCGVAAVYQNEWLQPVLCKIEKYKNKETQYYYSVAEETVKYDMIKERTYLAEILSNNNKEMTNTLKDEAKKIMKQLDMDASLQVTVLQMLEKPSNQPRMTKMALVHNKLFPEIVDAVRTSYQETSDPEEWTKAVEKTIENMKLGEISELLRRDLVQCAMTNYLMNEIGKIEELEKWSETGGFR